LSSSAPTFVKPRGFKIWLTMAAMADVFVSGTTG
jgi:hypothetical protein